MRPFADSWIWKWIDLFGDKTAISESSVIPVVSIQYGYGTQDAPNFRNIRVLFGKESNTPSLYMNGIIFFRLALPFYIGVQLKFSKDIRWQFGLGWKLNGRFVIGGWWALLWPLFAYLGASLAWYLACLPMIRRQSTESAAAGMDGPNYGQAIGWEDGST